MKKHNFNLSSLRKIVIKLAELGLDEEKIMQVIGINETEFEELKEDKLVKSALKKFAGLKEQLVEEALFKCAVGFEYDELTPAPASAKSLPAPGLRQAGGKDDGLVPTQKPARKTVLPNASACMFWLKSRAPERWLEPKDISEKETLKEFIKKHGKE